VPVLLEDVVHLFAVHCKMDNFFDSLICTFTVMVTLFDGRCGVVVGILAYYARGPGL
jgi:hypothetical protein